MAKKNHLFSKWPLRYGSRLTQSQYKNKGFEFKCGNRYKTDKGEYEMSIDLEDYLREKNKIQIIIQIKLIFR